ncbi:MAG: AMIN domain-containing protein, partial [Candidatus Angelobacter sp.]
MKFFSHSIHRKAQVLLCGFVFCASVPPTFAANHTASVQSVRLVPDEHGATIEIKADQAMTPQITPLDLPHRLVIDLPYAVTSHQGKRLPSRVKQITDVRFGQYTVKPPVVRIVVDLTAAVTYRLESTGNQLLVHLLTDEHAAPTIPSLAKEEQPAAVPV